VLEKHSDMQDLILLDPPPYGRGPDHETWLFEDHIAALEAIERGLLPALEALHETAGGEHAVLQSLIAISAIFVT
jgi:hypothetical protein